MQGLGCRIWGFGVQAAIWGFGVRGAMLLRGLGCEALQGLGVQGVRQAIYESWGFPKIRSTFVGSYNKDYTILGSTLRSPYFGKLPVHS